MHTTKQGVHAILPTGVSIPTPTFEPIYDATLLLVPDVTQDLVAGPFGQRAFIGFLGGNLTDYATGTLEGTIIGGFGGEFGIVSTNGMFYTDVALAVQWTDDDKYGFFRVQGIGELGNDTYATSYTRLETDSTTRQNLVDDVLLISITVDVNNSPSNETIAYFRLFAKNSTNPSISP
ncbi:hypothetical protein EV361DRAFT_645880 [Lentinula raphanica]|nr:hypothetical protein F5880DRAFT_961223 [Lentinula raphanica]KAJ3965534.1 hypothetical protein EV361DRAFT_645880 [Lentinula raphanica]